MLERKQDKEIQKLLNRMGRLTDEVVNYGTYVLDYCSETHKFNDYEIPIGTSFTQFLSLLDGVSILIKKGTSDPIKPLLRSMLELKFNIEYMLLEEDKKGIIAYQVSHAQNKINNWKMVDPSTQQGKEFAKKTKGMNIDLFTFNPEERIQELEQMLNKEPFKEVYEEWKRTKKQIKGKPNWHALFDGPKKISDLAEHLGQEAFYAVIYKNLSSFIHGNATVGRLKQHSPGIGINPGIRQLEELPSDLNFALTFAMDVYRKILKKYNPNRVKHFAYWYMVEVRDEFFQLTKANINVEYITDKKINP